MGVLRLPFFVGQWPQGLVRGLLAPLGEEVVQTVGLEPGDAGLAPAGAGHALLRGGEVEQGQYGLLQTGLAQAGLTGPQFRDPAPDRSMWSRRTGPRGG